MRTVTLNDPFRIWESSEFDRNHVDRYFVRVLEAEKPTRIRVGSFSRTDHGKAYYWITTLYSGSPAQIVPVPLWSRTWLAAVQFIPNRFWSSVPTFQFWY